MVESRRESMSIVVLKFGGTSVSTEENREFAFNHVIDELNNGNNPVVVVSAMGRKGAPYATDTLLSLVGNTCDKEAIDLVCSCGELISACVFADGLNKKGIKAKPFSGITAGVVTDENHGNSEIISMNTSNVLKAIDEGFVPVITGFQGQSVSGRITTLGRGGSDTSAVEIGGYLGADCVDIYTDVPGIAITDPRIVADAMFVEKISADDILLLAENGASVIHPRAVAAFKKHNLPILRVRSTFDKGEGTKIVNDFKAEGLVGIAVIKGLTESDDGAVSVCGRRYTKSDDGDIAAITVLDYKPGDIESISMIDVISCCKSKNLFQFTTSMFSMNRKVNEIYESCAK